VELRGLVVLRLGDLVLEGLDVVCDAHGDGARKSSGA
jgi:hypothetical protein